MSLAQALKHNASLKKLYIDVRHLKYVNWTLLTPGQRNGMDPKRLLSLVEAAQSSRHLPELDIAVRSLPSDKLSRPPSAAYFELWETIEC